MRRVIAALLLLAGCAGSAPDPRASITRAQIDRSTRPRMLIEVEGLDAAATAIPHGARDGIATWRTADNVGLSFRDGVVIATRGLGHDLMSADVAGTLAALGGGPQSGYSRLLTLLDGEGHTVFRAFLCEMGPPRPETVTLFDTAFATTRRDETCHTTGLTVANSYWQDADGTMRRARQWLSPGTGMLTTERLTRAGAAQDEGR